MKKILSLFLFLFIVLKLSGQIEKRITIIHTNDLHSRLTGDAPESAYSPLTLNDDKTTGGFARIATIIKDERTKSSGTTLVIDAGDFLMGTLFTNLEPKYGFQLPLMKKMGYDVIGLGNHEYDYGLDKLAAIIRTSASNGEIPQLLAGNAVFDDKDQRDDVYEKLFTDKFVARKMIITRGGLKIGLFSMLGKDADDVAPKAAPVTFSKQKSFAKRMVKELNREKCDLIICISHSGLSKDKMGEWVGEDFQIARAVKGLDLIISGHSHSRLEQPLVVNGIPIVQTGEFGKAVGSLSLIISGAKVSIDNYKLVTVDDKIPGDPEINNLIEEQKQKITSEILNPLGLVYDNPVAETEFLIQGNDIGDPAASNLGPFVADAIRFYVDANSDKGTDISMVAAGMLFDKIRPGIQMAPDLFRVMSLGSGSDNVPGYALSRLYFTGKELKSILEILLASGKSTPANFCYYSGIRVEYNPEKGLLKKIQKIEIIKPDGSRVNVSFSKKDNALYSVTADSYMLEFIGIIKKMSFGLINVVPKDADGNPVKDMKTAVIDIDETRPGIQEGKEWLALIKFLSQMKDTNGNGIPDIDKKYSVPFSAFIPVDSK